MLALGVYYIALLKTPIQNSAAAFSFFGSLSFQRSVSEMHTAEIAVEWLFQL
jgi:hypothetical protein